MSTEKNFHMSPDEFRKYGYAVIDWIANYQENITQYPIQSQVKPGDIQKALPESAPNQGESFEAILKDMDNIILPGITHWQSPNFYGYFPANTSSPSILGELFSSGLGVQGMLWITSPACTELETHVLDWLADMLGLPSKFKSNDTGGGVIQDSASSAVLTALIAARERITNFQSNKKGCDGKLVAYISTQTHSSLEKAVRIAGIGDDNLHIIPVNENFAMDVKALDQAIQEDRQAGRIPFFVCATIGTTSSNAIDPVPEIGRICKREGLWMHVDAAMSGTATICPEFRYLNNGLEYADSYAFNPHKWMFTNFDCDCFYVADRAHLIQTLSILPEYLRNQATETGAVFDYRDWQIQLGRRFRALKLWFVIRHYGIEGLQYHIRNHITLAQQFAQWIEDSPDFEMMAPAPLNLVCFRHKSDNNKNELLLKQLNQSGKLFLTHTKLNDQFTIRMVIGQTYTVKENVSEAWNLLQEFSRNL
jgi:aromatic-L-amino-acid/L-tryptophan decarboxylase